MPAHELTRSSDIRASRRAALAVALLLLGAATSAPALNKQGARGSDGDDTPPPPVNLSGYLFFGGFLFNPSYAARPNNTGRALFRFGLHLDLDLFRRYLTLSYDENSFTDGSGDTASILLPTEHDHIVGLLSQFRVARDLDLTLAVHYEIDAPGFHPKRAYREAHPDCATARVPSCYDAGYTQSYADAYARLDFSRGPLALAVALGGFLWNPSYAARPDNSGLALLRYVIHAELSPLPWLSLRADLNFFTDRDAGGVVPSELDAVAEVAARWRSFELRFTGEADLPLGAYPAGGPRPALATPGLRQMYLALLLQWSFDVAELLARRRRPETPSRAPSQPF